jgi:hypothetical protein
MTRTSRIVRFGSLAPDRYATSGRGMSASPPKADMPHPRRQLFANAAIAASRVAA